MWYSLIYQIFCTLQYLNSNEGLRKNFLYTLIAFVSTEQKIFGQIKICIHAIRSRVSIKWKDDMHVWLAVSLFELWSVKKVYVESQNIILCKSCKVLQCDNETFEVNKPMRWLLCLESNKNFFLFSKFR